jgi:hypothetical protein
MNRFDPKAIIIAMLLSLTLDVFGSIVLVSAFGVRFSEGMTPEQLDAAVQAVMQGSGFLFAALLFGVATTVLGGFVAAHLARRFPYFNALAVGVLGIVLGLLLTSEAPWWFDALAYLLSVPAAVGGGHLAMLRRRNQ